ncbi:MAG: permease [Candidatus Poribacteria bacterium]|nr:MAG: permease [Candidatus Poribacteria bacterium]
MRWFVRGDIDGFFGLFIDNLIQLMLIVVLGGAICGFPDEVIVGRMLPAAALSLLIGNFFYGWQARKLMRETGREDVTALPYGINTPSLFAYVFFIMGPIYRETGSWQLAWQAGLFACLWSGLIETSGAFVGDWLRRNTPRAALLSALAGIAITFIAMGFVFQIFAAPFLAILPMFIILVAYASKRRMPLGLPGGLFAVIVGVVLAAFGRALGVTLPPSNATPFTPGFYPPVPVFRDALALLFSEAGWKYFSIIFPMGLFNVIGSLQNLESAEAAGDRYPTRPSLLVNGVGTIAAALFGSPYPTTIYIGHPGWKALGARAGYSILNGAVVTGLCLIGGVSLVLKVVPIEVTLGILLWVGIIITAQAFQETPREHALAVAVGLVPSLAAWALQLVQTALLAAGTTLLEALDRFGGDLYIHGVIALNQGFIITSMLYAAVLVYAIEGRFRTAALWTFAGAILAFFGVIHGYEVTAAGVANRFGWGVGREFALMYALTGLFLLWLQHRTRRQSPQRS